MNILVTVAIVVVCGFVLWFGISAIIKIWWQQSVEIGEIVDDKDGSSGKRAQAIIDFVLREAPEIHRKADLTAISVGNVLDVPMISRPDPGLEGIEKLDISLKDVHLNWAISLFRAVSKPSCEVSGRLLAGTKSTEIVLELTDKSIRSTPLLVSVSRTADETSDNERVATEAGYQLLYDIYRRFAEDKSRVPGNWIALARFTEGLRSLQQYRLTARSGDAKAGQNAKKHLDNAIEKLEQVRQVDPGYNDGLYYLGVAYFEDRRWAEAIAVFEELLKREPPQSLEAQFYLGYAWFRTYDGTGMTNALTQYGALLDKLRSRLEALPPPEENKRALGLLAETYSQIATTYAHLLFIQKRDCPPNQEESVKRSAVKNFNATSEYAGYAELLSTEDANVISPEILADVKWRRLNALGTAEFSFARFDRSDYDKHCWQALKYYEEALQSSPLNPNILENQAEIYRDEIYCEGDLDRAEKLYLQAKDIAPQDYYPLQQLGIIYETRWKKPGNPDDKKEMDEKKMIEYYKQAVDLGSRLAKTRLDELRAGAKGESAQRIGFLGERKKAS